MSMVIKGTYEKTIEILLSRRFIQVVDKTVKISILNKNIDKSSLEYYLVENLKKRYGESFPLFCEQVRYYLHSGRSAFHAIYDSILDADSVEKKSWVENSGK